MKKAILLGLSLLWMGYATCANALDHTQKEDKEKAVPTAQAMYGAARAEFDHKRFDQAIKLYEVLETQYPYSEYAKQAKMDKAYAYHQNDQPKEALTAIEQFVKLYPKHPDIDYLYYLQALVYCETHRNFLTEWNKPKKIYQDPQPNLRSLTLLKNFIKEFPQSQYIANAEQKITQITQELSEHTLLIARYNMRRAAYIAAVNRAHEIIQQYPNTSSAEEALAILMKSYGKLGHNELSQWAKTQLQTSYPKSTFLK